MEHTIIAYTRNSAFIKENIPQEEFAIVRRSYAQVRQVSDFNEITEDFVKITIHDPLFRCMETREKLSPFFQSAYIVASEAAWIDIANVNVHKGATYSFAVRNAVQELKDAANFITRSNEEDAVMKTIMQMLFLK